jgi:putative transposase
LRGFQRRYPRSWRFTKGVRRAIERHGERVRNISQDYAHKLGGSTAELALKYRSLIILEDLEKLRENSKRDRKFNKRLGLGSTVGYSSASSTRLGRVTLR